MHSEINGKLTAQFIRHEVEKMITESQTVLPKLGTENRLRNDEDLMLALGIAKPVLKPESTPKTQEAKPMKEPTKGSVKEQNEEVKAGLPE